MIKTIKKIIKLFSFNNGEDYSGYNPLAELGYIDEQIANCEMKMTKEKMTKEKICPKCGKVKPSTEFYDYNSAGNTHTYWCKECIEYYIENTSVGAN